VFLSNKHPGKQAPQAWASIDAGAEHIGRLLDLRQCLVQIVLNCKKRGGCENNRADSLE
jgi:hypothetical protein